MKIFIGEFMHEGSTFAPGKTTFETLKELRWEIADNVLKTFKGGTDFISGMITVAEQNDVELIPTFATWNAGPIMDKECYESLKKQIIDKLIEVKDEISGICFALHGSGMVEEIGDLEADLLRSMRKIVGYEMPIIVTLDLHTNMSEEMMKETQLYVGCNEYPHIDCDKAGKIAMDILIRTIKKEIKPVSKLVKVPMLIARGCTLEYPAKEVKDFMLNCIKENNLLDASFLHGFPFADTKNTAAYVLVITDNDLELATKVANKIAQKIWDLRKDFQANNYNANEGIDKAMEIEGGPIVINETSDNAGGGAPGNGTHLLRVMLERNTEKTCFGYIYDPVVAQIAHKAGIGSKIDITLGSQTDDLHGGPIDIKGAYVKNLSDGIITIKNPMMKDRVLNLEKSARLVIGNVDVIVCSVPMQTFDDQIFLLHGVDVKDYKIIALKSSNHFRGFFENVGKQIITVDTPGITTSTFAFLEYNNLKHPIYPLDKDISLDFEEIQNKAFSI